MTDVAARPFTGFTPDALQFLFDLAGHNERSWFQAHKKDYERLLKEPLEALCDALAERFEQKALPLSADPVRSPFRIYRDVRFSKDKSPYKTNVAASFPWVGDTASEGDEPQRHGIGAYFHLSVEQVYAGGGVWHPERERIAAFRTMVDREPARVEKALEDPAFVARYGTINGERLTRVPQGYSKDHPRAELLKLKDVVFGRSLSEAEAFSPHLPDTLADDFATAIPVFRLLASLPA